MRGLIFWFFDFAPTLIAWFRVREGKPPVNTLRQLFFIDCPIGWTADAATAGRPHRLALR